MNLSQNGKTITGTARMTTNKIAGATVQGAEFTKQVDRVSGNMEGDDFYVTIGTAGIYRGKVGPSGGSTAPLMIETSLRARPRGSAAKQ